MADYRITLTSAGLELLAKATAGKQLVFTGVQLGDGDTPDSFQDMTALISPRKTLPIRSVIHIGAKANIKAVLDYTAITEDFPWKEVGLIASDPDTDCDVLYCYGNAGNKGDWITSGITATAKSINLTVLVSESASITAVIDDKANYAAVDLSNVESVSIGEKIKEAVTAGELAAADLDAAAKDLSNVESAAVSGKVKDAVGDGELTATDLNVAAITLSNVESASVGGKVKEAVIAGKLTATDLNAAAKDLSNVESASVSGKVKDAVAAGTLTADDLRAIPRQNGKAGQILGFSQDNVVGAMNPPASGVTAFNGRSGAVTPSSGDYNVSQVTGAAPKDSPEFTGSISLGRKTGSTTGKNSLAVGINAEATGRCCIAIGEDVKASDGWTFALGYRTRASNTAAHAEGDNTTASGYSAHAEGVDTTASGNFSHAAGKGTIAGAECQTVIGFWNVENTDDRNPFIIGCGVEAAQRKNCFRAGPYGIYSISAYNTSGADYAEMFEWLDGNPENQDRTGMFVTLDGEKIRIAKPDDDFILGIISGNPSVVGDVHDDQWKGMHETDIFGRPIFEMREFPAEIRTILRPDGTEENIEITPAQTRNIPKLNSNYNREEKYAPRSERPEWDAVGMMGKLVALDDGSCEVNGWCQVGTGGIAIKSETRTRYRVMARLDDTHIRILIM